jgi:hypothetical protein
MRTFFWNSKADTAIAQFRALLSKAAAPNYKAGVFAILSLIDRFTFMPCLRLRVFYAINRAFRYITGTSRFYPKPLPIFMMKGKPVVPVCADKRFCYG